MPEKTVPQILFEKLVEDEQSFARKCIRKRVSAEEIKAVVDRFLSSRAAKKIYDTSKKSKRK
tara:strand:- start:2737 stop:2922 length:186 start_codon:yes stop_codon:yes gene_type:complete